MNEFTVAKNRKPVRGNEMISRTRAATCVMLLVRAGKIEYVDFDNKPVFDIIKADSSRD